MREKRITVRDVLNELCERCGIMPTAVIRPRTTSRGSVGLPDES